MYVLIYSSDVGLHRAFKTHGMSGRNITVKHTGKYNFEPNYRITMVPLLFFQLLIN